GAPATPIRKLPRRKAAPPPVAVRIPPRKFPEPSPQSEDRVRPLLKGNFISLRLVQVDDLHHQLRLAPAALVVQVTDLHGVEPTPIPNRWKIFPTAPWRRYDNN